MYVNNASNFDPSYENITRKIDMHKKMHKDDQLLPKVRNESLANVSMLLAQRERDFVTANADSVHSRVSRSDFNITAAKEEFY